MVDKELLYPSISGILIKDFPIAADAVIEKGTIVNIVRKHEPDKFHAYTRYIINVRDTNICVRVREEFLKEIPYFKGIYI